MAPRELAAIGITNQRETTGLWDRETGKPVHRAIVWQDRRTTGECAALKEAGREPFVRDRTGLVLDPYFSGTKLRWLLDNVRGARERAEAGRLAFGTIDTFLVWRLTGGRAHVTDVSNASRTLLMDLRTRATGIRRAARALRRAGESVLPEIRSSSEVYGTTRGLKGLPDGIPVAGIAGDQQAALFGQACFTPGDVEVHLRHRRVPAPEHRHEPVALARAACSPRWPGRSATRLTYALEGSSFIAGAAVQWLRDGLGIIRRSADVEALARSVKDTGGVVFVPALAGLGAPHWRPAGARR